MVVGWLSRSELKIVLIGPAKATNNHVDGDVKAIYLSTSGKLNFIFVHST